MSKTIINFESSQPFSQSADLPKRSISSSHKAVLKSQESREINTNSQTETQIRAKNSSFHTKRDFKFQGNVNFNLTHEKIEENTNKNNDEMAIERPRFSTLNVTNKSKQTLKRSVTLKKPDETNNISEIDLSRTNLSIETESGEPNKFQQVNIFRNSRASIKPLSPKTPIKKLTLKKSFSNQRPSVVSIFSRIKKKENLDLSDDEDFKCIIAILRKAPFNRTDHEIVLLKSAFGEVKFFEERKTELSVECYDRLFRELKYEFMEKRRPVFNIGDMGRNFYIIIQGSVSILLKKKGLEQNPDEKFVKKDEGDNEDNLSDDGIEKKRKRMLLKKILNYENNNDPNLQKEVDDISDEDFLNVRYPSFFMMRKMKNGEFFGEIALRQNVPRTATIIADQETHFAILTRDSYQNILKIYDDQMINNKIDFLIGMPVFQGWSTASMEQLFRQFRIETYGKNKTFYKEGDSSAFLYFIQIGEIEITKYIDLQEENTKKRASFHQSESFLPNIKRKIEENRQRIRISLLGPNCMFGHEEILNRTKRKTKALVVSSNATVFFIQKEAFFNYVKNYNTVKILESINRLNKSWHETLSGSIQSFLQNGSSQENKPMIPFIKGNVHRKSFSLSKLENKEKTLLTTSNNNPTNNFTERKNEELENSKKWMYRKIASNENDQIHKIFKGGHMSKFVASFNDFYEKIEHKLDNSKENSYGFDNVLIENPFGKHILEIKLRNKFRTKEKNNVSGFGRYLSEETKRKIMENHNNNSFFSMNFCKNVVTKKRNPLEKVLLEKLNASRIEEKNKKNNSMSEEKILNDLNKN